MELNFPKASTLDYVTKSIPNVKDFNMDSVKAYWDKNSIDVTDLEL